MTQRISFPNHLLASFCETLLVPTREYVKSAHSFTQHPTLNTPLTKLKDRRVLLLPALALGIIVAFVTLLLHWPRKVDIISPSATQRNAAQLSQFTSMTLREWQRTVKPQSDLILQASPLDGSDSWQQWPIGMQYKYITTLKAQPDPEGAKLQIGPHDRTVFCAFNITDSRSGHRRQNGTVNRAKIEANLAQNGVRNGNANPWEYYRELPRYKFVVSPEGNGIDTHRHYEALMAGAIPIMEHNPVTIQKYGLMPVLFTTDYSEITVPYLEAKYEEMLDKEYNFVPLFLSFYPRYVQTTIQRLGNYWCQKLENRPCYDATARHA